jgi:hypothetical protein
MTPYEDAMAFIKSNYGSSSSAGMAKLILSLYNSGHSFGLGECLNSFDGKRLVLAQNLILHYMEYGEDGSLREAGRKIYEIWPRLIELSDAASLAKAEVREKWHVEDTAHYANDEG